MHQVEIEVFKAQVTQRLIECLLNLITVVASVTMRQYKVR